MREKEFLECYESGVSFFMEIYNLYKNSYKRNEYNDNAKKERENNTIFTLLSEDVLRECIARGFAVRGYKVTAEVLYKNVNDKDNQDLQIENKEKQKGKSGSLDLLITDEKEQDENNKYYALELKIEKNKDTCGSGIRDIIFDAYRLVIDKENNYRKKIQDSQKYTVLLVNYKYIEENKKNNNRRKWDGKFYEQLEKELKNNFNLINIYNEVKRIKNEKGLKDTKWNEWLKIIEENQFIKLNIIKRREVDKDIEIILFKCD
jgi:hypothetical protein